MNLLELAGSLGLLKHNDRKEDDYKDYKLRYGVEFSTLSYDEQDYFWEVHEDEMWELYQTPRGWKCPVLKQRLGKLD